ncbi:RagB/SusD family nutrient uptake outer membrane protein [Chitinophaga lutea]|uniref:RagB/SusD family nutrient uptake outer membrane protein n=1 Tax=Chitinophaga lutea TaxID=2488634 RepID=A0A3N4Q2I2_9BACT|nr:RagB/SusD family nutrient uptake outer membrane protein [Chitinophaga lutea]RPE13409.1 RagB/SusD family nutrient uptake outer membrane protein [Chitinophaga lutea]
MKSYIYILAVFVVLFSACKKDFLERGLLDQMEDEKYWTNEKNVRIYATWFYPSYFNGYGQAWVWGDYFYQGQSLNDDFAPVTPPQFTKVVPATDTSWGFRFVRRSNIMIDRVSKMSSLDAATMNHWLGVGRFFRAMAYFRLVKKFGDVPWYGRELQMTEEQELYKPRDPRTLVMDSMMKDLRFAAENVRAVDGEKGLNVTKWVVLAYMSRIALFEGTWQKYHANNPTKAAEYLEAARWAAEEVMTKGGFNFSNTYRESFNSLDLSKNQEMIMYRRYATGLVTHALMSYVNGEGQTGPNKSLMESYLCTDGLPVGVSAVYAGDKTNEQVRTNRDPRLLGTFNPELRPQGSIGRYNRLGVSTSGYATWKFLNDEQRDRPEGASNVNVIHAPVIRYGEVLVTYAEARAELGQLTQADLDRSINVLRNRPSDLATKLPQLQIQGGLPAVNGKTYDDPKRDPSVPAMIWEIRRERRVELTMEGYRLDDLRRWKKLDYLDMTQNPDLNRGAWINKAEWAKPGGGSWLAAGIVLEGGGQQGYILGASSAITHRPKPDPKVYLSPIPLDQIKLYSDKKSKLEQNPGWTQ